jgi:hypothetical protein
VLEEVQGRLFAKRGQMPTPRFAGEMVRYVILAR